MKTPIITKLHLTNAITFTAIILLISIFSSCNDSCDCDPTDSQLCFAQHLGTVIPGSDTHNWPIIDEKTEMMYYFDGLHKTLVSLDMKSGFREIVLPSQDLYFLLPFEIVDSLLFAYWIPEENGPSSIYKFNLNTKTGSTIIENDSAILIGDGEKIFYESGAHDIYESDFNGVSSKLDIQGTPLSYSKSSNLLLVQEYLPARISTYNIVSKQKDLVKHLNTDDIIYNYYWSGDEIIEVMTLNTSKYIENSPPKSLTITNLTKNKIIRKIEGYLDCTVFPLNNTLAYSVIAQNDTCQNSQIILYVEDLNNDKSYKIADTGIGYFMEYHIYKNKQKIVYWESTFRSFYQNDLE